MVSCSFYKRVYGVGDDGHDVGGLLVSQYRRRQTNDGLGRHIP